MPTGYTADVANGKVTDFRTFALRCARAFGATIMQRDDPMNEPPKPREVSEYDRTAVAEREAKVAALDAMTIEQANDAAALAYGEAVKRRRDAIQRDTDTRNRYNAMLAEVVAWEPPTPDHVELKHFMVQQLTEARKFDTGFTNGEPPVRQSGALWLAQEKAEAARALAYARVALAKEIERVEGANAWIAALYDALPETVPA